jgi:hypothetical protein
MSFNLETTDDTTMASLSYDDSIPYEEQVSLNDNAELPQGGLADRISSSRLYLLSDSSKPSKRKRDDEGPLDLDNGKITDEAGNTYRPNALLISGTPVCLLSTARIFAYTTHFDAHPLGLEWVDDSSCVLVFDNAISAKVAHRRLQKSGVEEPDMKTGFVTAKPIPIEVWPPEERINQTLGKGEGLKGTLRMRYARSEDAKKKGAKRESEFYKKHGEFAGKEIYGDKSHDTKRRRRDEETLNKAQLDADLDQFLAGGGEEEEQMEEKSPSPVSKMRSDYIANDGRTLLDRTSIIRLHGEVETPLLERLADPRPQRPLPSRRGRESDHGSSGRRTPTDRRRGQESRVRKTQQELDDELDAFLGSRE